MQITQLTPWLAAAVYGSWAGYSNASDSSLTVWITSALVQGSFAFCATLLLTQIVVSLLLWRNSRLPKGLVFALCSMVLLLVPTVMHLMVGTPSLIQSILPGAVIGHCYLAYLVFYVNSSSISNAGIYR